MDLPGQDPAILLDCLGDLYRVNRWLGGTWLTISALESLTRDFHPGTDLAIVDLATNDSDRCYSGSLLGWDMRGRITLICLVDRRKYA